MTTGKDSGATRRHSDMPSPVTAPIVPAVPSIEPTKVGRYQLNDKLGEGEFGLVYRAVHVDHSDEEMEYAVKILHDKYTRSDYRSLSQEATLLQKLSHRTLPRFIETGICSQAPFNNRPYLVMEFIPGHHIADYLEQNSISPDTALRWIYELSEGLVYLHNQAVIHRDIKPANIQVAWSERHGRSLRILDFGIALIRGQHVPEIIGTLKYMSPEQFATKPITTASDIYSLGLVLYELLSGVYPYSIDAGNNVAAWAEIHRKSTPKPLAVTNIPGAVCDVVMACLAKQPESRPSASQLLYVMEKEVSGIGLPSYVGILGHRGSGKTCYLTSLYHISEMTPETRNILEDKCLDLYEKGDLPSATALSAYRLNFKITTARRYYDIVTKDYGGELLAGRREERLNTEEVIDQEVLKEKRNEVIDQEVLKEKRNEVYEFFQSARAILIIVETMPVAQDLRTQIDYRKEIESLIERIAQVRQGKREIKIPVAMVLTKWDRIGDVSKSHDQEQRRALEYIEQTEWLAQLYYKLRILCPHFDVFPVYSFIGDKPSRENIRPFNIDTPLLWSIDQSDIALLDQAKEIENDDEYHHSEKLSLYWRLLNVEKISDRELRDQIKAGIHRLSQSYLDAVKTRIAADSGETMWAIAQYRGFLQTKGICSEEQEEAQRELRRLERKRQGDYRRKMIWLSAAAILALVAGWATWGVYAERLAEQQLARAIDRCKILLAEQLAVPPATVEKFAGDDWTRLVNRLGYVEGMILKYDDRLAAVKRFQSGELQLKIKQPPLTAKAADLQQQRGEWLRYQGQLTAIKLDFEKWRELIQQQERLTRQQQDLERRWQRMQLTRTDLDEAGRLFQQGVEHRQALANLRDAFNNYLTGHGNGLFRAQAEQAVLVVQKNLEYWDQRLQKSRSEDDLHRMVQDLANFDRDSNLAQLTPDQSDSVVSLRDKQQKLQAWHGRFRTLAELLKSRRLAGDQRRRYQQLAARGTQKIAELEHKCDYWLAGDQLNKLVQSIQYQIESAPPGGSLATRLADIAKWQAKLHDWALPLNIAAADRQDLEVRKNKALHQFAIYTICREMEQSYRSGEIAALAIQDSDPPAVVTQKQAQLEGWRQKFRQVKTAIAAKTIPPSQADPYTILCRQCEALLDQQGQRQVYYDQQNELDKLAQEIRVEVQTIDATTSLAGKLKRIVNLLEKLAAWQPAGQDKMMAKDYTKLLAQRNQIWQEFAIYQTCQELQSFEHDNGIRFCRPKQDDPLPLVRDKQQKIAAYLDKCRKLEEAIAKSSLPPSQTQIWQNLCRKCRTELSEHHQKCRFFLVQEELRQAAMQRYGDTSEDNRYTLEEKLAIVKQRLNWLDSIVRGNLAEDNWRQLSEQKGRVASHYHQAQTSLDQARTEIERLAKACQQWDIDWRQEITRRQSYNQCLAAISELEYKIAGRTSLKREYQGLLTTIGDKIKAMKKKDYDDFARIGVKVRNHRFLIAKAEAQGYYHKRAHARIMTESLQRYFANFSADVTVRLAVDASGVSDPGSSNPDIELKLSGAHDGVYSQDDKKQWQGTFGLDMQLGENYPLTIKVIERDPGVNDDYGTFTVDITNLLDNQKIEYAHQCGSDGTLSVSLTAAIVPNVEFPNFEGE